MDTLWNRLKYLTFTDRKKIVQAEFTRPQILRLPTEILILIVGMLPSSSAACLALCNHQLYYTLGPDHLLSIRNQPSDVFLAFLSALATDIPQHFACQECMCLHRTSDIHLPIYVPLTKRPRCTRKSSGYRHIDLWRYQIHFPHVFLAMKQYRSGIDFGMPIEAFQHIEVRHDKVRQKTRLLFAEAQVVENELFIRSQTWYMLPWAKREEFIESLRICNLQDICTHTRLGPLPLDLVSDLVKDRLVQLDNLNQGGGLARTRTPTLQCPHCLVDYEIDAINFQDEGFGVVFTRWVNLGAGLEVVDPKWQCHDQIHLPKDYQSHSLGSIRTSFEDQAKISVEEFTLKNQRIVFSSREAGITNRASNVSTYYVWRWDPERLWHRTSSGPPQTLWRVLRGF